MSTSEKSAVAISPTKTFDLSPQNFEQAESFAIMLADSGMVPKDFAGKPGACMIAVQWGAELGLKPLQAIQNIAVINGRPSLWGDVVLALVKASPAYESIQETDDGSMATCRVKRKGEPEHVATFSMDDAQRAGLAGKAGPWVQYPKRMRQMRARAFALRDVFPDVLKGISVAEEAGDMPPVYMGAAEEVAPAGQSVAEERTPPTEKKEEVVAKSPLPDYPAAEFAKNLPEWRALVQASKPVDRIVSRIQTKYTLTPEQLKAIKALQANDVTDVNPKDAPAYTVEEVDQRIRNAKNVDELNLAGGLIAAVGTDEERDALNQLWDDRNAYFQGK